MSTLQHAYSLIKGQLETGVWNRGDRLPSLSELAVKCKVSRTTMWHAVGMLQKESLVHAKKGGYITAGARSDHQSIQLDRQGLLWQRLKTRIGRDILSGTFTDKKLPPISKLAVHYGVTSPTLHKALSQLVQDGFLQVDGHRFRPAPHHSSQHQPFIVLISQSDHTGKILQADLRTQTIVESIERECPGMGYNCRIEGFDSRRANSLLEIRAAIKNINTISGFIISIWNPWDDVQWQRWLDLLILLAGRQVPVIVVDHADNLRFSDPLLHHSKFRCIRISGEKSGEKVADLLFRRGHRHFAFLTGDAKTEWAIKRYDGIKRYLAQYGDTQTTLQFSAPEISITWNELLFAFLDLDAEDVRALFHGQSSKDQIRNLIALVQHPQFPNLKNQVVDKPALATFKPMIHTLRKMMNTPHDPVGFANLQTSILKTAGNCAFGKFMEPVFQSVLKKSSATAWVCDSDTIALAAVSFLKNHGNKIPDDISIIGFDNWREAAENQLSTFDFNMTGIIKKSLLMIADEKLLKSTPVISEVDGYVVERRTTLRPGSLRQ
jgi:DNA-binding LacI/PurR family transcriptional regulator/DNA-binding FadR family transcriptional regulator